MAVAKRKSLTDTLRFEYRTVQPQSFAIPTSLFEKCPGSEVDNLSMTVEGSLSRSAEAQDQSKDSLLGICGGYVTQKQVVI
jgi:hypothetical protein